MNKLKWQTGKPPKDGWYWVKQTFEMYPGSKEIDVQVFIQQYHSTFCDLDRSSIKWAGPIPEPEQGDGDHKP